MKKRLDQILSVMIGAFIGVFIGHSLFKFVDFRRRPEIYAIQSAPWYTGLILRGVVVAAAVGVAAAIKLFLRKKSN